MCRRPLLPSSIPFPAGSPVGKSVPLIGLSGHKRLQTARLHSRKPDHAPKEHHQRLPDLNHLGREMTPQKLKTLLLTVYAKAGGT